MTRVGVVWAGEGRSSETLGAFFKQLGPGGCARVELVTADLASSWQKALAVWVPQARVVFDRFHVERLASDAVDEVRRSEQRRLAPADAKALKGTRYALLKHPARLKPEEARRLEGLRRENRALGPRLRVEGVAEVGRAVPPGAVREAGPHDSETRDGYPGVSGHPDDERTGGGYQQRRAYGFHSAGALTSMLFLCCGGIELAPPLPTVI